MKTSEILLEAIEVLNTRGWCKGEFYKGDIGDGPCCVEGAIRATISNDPSHWTYAASKATSVLEDAIGSMDAAHWNDKKSRRKSQVISALKKAAKMAAKEEKERGR